MASLFYQQRLGTMEVRGPNATFEVDLLKRRQYIIRAGELKGMFDSEIDIKDDILQMVLSGNSGARLKDIIATIQKEQDDIIREPLENNILLNGVAGSGKTTIILRRIAYLLYNYRSRLKDNILIVGPNKLFMEYISDVLPDLGERDNTFQMTIPMLAREIIRPRREVMSAEEYYKRLGERQIRFEKETRRKTAASFKKELDEIKAEPSEKKRIQKAQEFQDKLAGLKFLDPACGSGNFLTETFLSLRRLENEAIRIIHRGQMMIGEFVNPIKVSINQFYGIEINDFAVSVAMTALWIAEAQMLFETEKIMQISLDFLPLKNYSNIKEGNALRLDWSYWENDDDSTVVLAEHTHIYPVQTIPEDTLQEPVVKYGSVDVYSPDVQIHTTGKGKAFRRVKFDYIMGNPPFLGARVMSAAQKDDLINVFGPKWKNVGNMDYVTGWYKKSLEMMLSNPQVRAALVSTNSITQGEQVANLWRPLMEAGIHIDFAWRTFIWDSEANQKAHVHCVIIGFSICHSERKRRIFDGNTVIEAANINGYLVDAPSVAIDNRTKPICDVPEMVFGSMPNDGGFLSNYSDEDRQIIITQYPQALPLFKRLLGATEFINNTIRWCIWLKGVSPLDYIKIPPIMEAISKVREMRQNSSRKSTRKLSDTPMLFGEIRQPESEYLLVPSTSSENRSYIPIGFISPEIISNNANLLVPHASMYTFGIMTSSVHMAWMRIVCGRLKSDYRYSANIVYNNFPWPAPTEEQKARIEQTAQAILDARQLYADASFADLYGNLIIFPELTKAHRANDAAVMEAYGFRKDMTEPEIVAELFKMYQKLANN